MIQTEAYTALSTGASTGKKRNSDTLSGYAFISPWLLGVVIFVLGPMLLTLYFSFTNFSLLKYPTWTGFQNYTKMFRDPLFYQSLKVTFTFVFVSVPIKLAFALFVAMLLRKAVRAVGIYRAVYYLPSLVGGSVAVAYMWKQLFNVNGLVNQVLLWFGIQGPSWLTDPKYALFTISLLQAWQFGSSMLIFLAGLQQVPETLYEASSIDGATRITQFFRVTLPMISPVLFFNIIMQMIGSFTQFTQGYVLTNGGPLNSTLFYALYLYQQGFTYFQMGYASALAWILVIIIGIFAGLLFWTSRRWVYYESDEGRDVK